MQVPPDITIIIIIIISAHDRDLTRALPRRLLPLHHQILTLMRPAQIDPAHLGLKEKSDKALHLESHAREE